MEVLQAEGFADASYVPLGIESDMFNPWGNITRRYERTTFLWLSLNQYRKGLDVMLKAGGNCAAFVHWRIWC